MRTTGDPGVETLRGIGCPVDASRAPSTRPASLLRVERLEVVYRRPRQVARRLVRDVSLEIYPGQIVCVVGESGSGKSLSAQAIMGLLGDEPYLRVAGEVDFGGRDLLGMGEEEQRHLRGREMTMVFQEPMSCLDPVMRVGVQVGEALRRIGGVRREREEVRSQTLELLRRVGLPDVERVYRSYPHELSGGMCQRVMIAMALAPKPKLLIADEPTTALDVTVQAQILDLLVRLRDEEGMSILLITHDMAVAAAIADRVVVVYAGRTVEADSAARLFDCARHPYTKGLLRALPRLQSKADKTRHLPAIAGSVPEPGQLPDGCAFWPRCDLATDHCRVEDPPLEVSGVRAVACWEAGHDA